MCIVRVFVLSAMGFDEDDCDYAKGFTSSVDEVTEKDSYSATAIDEKPRDYKVR